MAESRLFLEGPFKADLRRPLPPADERRRWGRAARERVPRRQLGVWEPPQDRADPVETVSATAVRRQKALVPIRNTRMAASALAFYRGTAELMASDLATQPHTGLNVQLCGDAHLSNFGLYASRERTLVFDINDLDETSQGPWEWDLKRLTTSFVLAARENGVPEQAESAVREAALSYVYTLGQTANAGWLARRYQIVRAVPQDGQRRWDKETNAAIDGIVAKASGRTQRWTVERYAELRDGRLRLRLDPPLISAVSQRTQRLVASALNRYFSTLSAERRAFLYGYSVIDVAHKVVGVGSVGMYDYVVLLQGDGPDDHLLLQVKEAGPSAVKQALAERDIMDFGQRVVVGSWLLQAVSDPFLGWTSIGDRAFYVRQLKDMKGSVPTPSLSGPPLSAYAIICGLTLALAHSRAGDPHALLGYIGKGRTLADAMWAFSAPYADQAERDYQAFKAAVDGGRLPAAAPEVAGIATPKAAPLAKGRSGATGGRTPAKGKAAGSGPPKSRARDAQREAERAIARLARTPPPRKA